MQLMTQYGPRLLVATVLGAVIGLDREIRNRPAGLRTHMILSLAGVSFLAAGTIIRAGRNVTGLTTGAGMWLAGAVGLACGLERYGLAVLAAGLAVIILAVLMPLDSWIGRSRDGTPTKTD